MAFPSAYPFRTGIEFFFSTALLAAAKPLSGKTYDMHCSPVSCAELTERPSRSLAHKLTIRMSDAYPSGKLIEINANSVLSKWLGESGKIVKQLFDNIFNVARDRTTLVFVLIDEVESIAGSRLGATSRVECADSLRATNQLLTALDHLRLEPNVLVFCTTNLIGSIVGLHSLPNIPAQSCLTHTLGPCILRPCRRQADHSKSKCQSEI